MTIAAILGRKGGTVVSVECDTSVREAVARLAGNRIGAVPVVESMINMSTGSIGSRWGRNAPLGLTRPLIHLTRAGLRHLASIVNAG